jgi:hypothetical protein
VPPPRALVTTPFHLKTLLLAGVALPAVDLVLSATAPLSPQLAAQAEATFGGLLAEIYGCTEAGQVAARRTTAGETWTTWASCRSRRSAAADGDRELHRRRRPRRGTHAAGRRAGAAGLAPLPLLGRANDLIHVAGKRSSLAHLNFHLNRIEGVDDGAFWLPDEVAEAVVRTVAFVVAPAQSAQAIIAALREHAGNRLRAAPCGARARLPREATGKLTVAALRRFALQTLAALESRCPGRAPRMRISSIRQLASRPTTPPFAGHFPGHPVLPGVALLSLVMQALAAARRWRHAWAPQPSIDNAKFLSARGPGATLQVRCMNRAAAWPSR